MSDPRLVPGVWVNTRFGPAVAIEVGPHRHRVGPPAHLDEGGVCHCACESDECADAAHVYYRYKAHRPNRPDVAIWVVNGDLTAGCGEDNVTFLREADDVSTHVLTLTGPYGEGPILPPRPPAVVPPGPTAAVRATFEEVSKFGSDLWMASFEQRPNVFNYDIGDADVARILDEWFVWEEETRRARLSELGWTVEEYDDASGASLRAYIESMGKSPEDFDEGLMKPPW